MNDSYFLKLAIEQARKSVKLGGFPAGAIVVRNGEVISQGISVGFSLYDPTSHAETAAIRDACIKLNTTDLSGATLYGSLECCVMCFSVCNWSGISRIVYAVKKTTQMVLQGYYEGYTNNEKINKENTRQIELVFSPELSVESLKVISDWEKQGGFKRNSA